MMESAALLDPSTQVNVTDGHPRMPLSTSQQLVISRLPAMFDEALRRPYSEIEQQAQTALLSSLGQHEAPIGTGRIASTYSSTVALDVVARALRDRTDTALVLHPTFDNIADLLRARRMRLTPVTEQQIERDTWRLDRSVGAVVLVSPNNPTGWVLSRSALRRVAERCAEGGAVLVIDASFRGQDPRAQYDAYAVVGAAGCEWVIVEDTGKLWPVHELKVGLLAWGPDTRLDLVRALSEVLLSVSPVILQLIAALAMDGAAGGYRSMRATLQENRALVANIIAPSRLTVTDPDARISVARLSLPSDGPDADTVCRELRQQNVHALPCRRFYWSRVDEGARQIRLSLARTPELIHRAAVAVAEVAG